MKKKGIFFFQIQFILKKLLIQKKLKIKLEEWEKLKTYKNLNELAILIFHPSKNFILLSEKNQFKLKEEGGTLETFSDLFETAESLNALFQKQISSPNIQLEGPIRMIPTYRKSQLEEEGNHLIESGKTLEITPSLKMPQTWIIINGSKEDRLFIRGTGPKMNWSEGPELLHIGNGKFVFELPKETYPDRFDFKIVKNNIHWCQGNNFSFVKGDKPLEITPKF